MAVLTPLELARARRSIVLALAQAGHPIDFTKPQLNTAIQNLEDAVVSTTTTFTAATETAAPGRWNGAEKTIIIAWAFHYAAQRRGVIT